MFSLDLNSHVKFSKSFDYYVESRLGLHRPVVITADELTVILTVNGNPLSYSIHYSNKTTMRNDPQQAKVAILSIQYHDNEFIKSNFPDLFLAEYALLTDYSHWDNRTILGDEYSELIVAADNDKFPLPSNLSLAVTTGDPTQVPTNLTGALYAYLNNTMLWLGVNEKLFLKVIRKTLVQTVVAATPIGTTYVVVKFMMKAIMANFFDNLIEQIKTNSGEREEVKGELKKRK